MCKVEFSSEDTRYYSSYVSAIRWAAYHKEFKGEDIKKIGWEESGRFTPFSVARATYLVHDITLH